MIDFGKTILILGCILAMLGLGLIFLSRWSNVGHLPGDILVKKKNFSFYFPITTCLLISALLSLVFYYLRK